ncbi:Xaa-Pro dipeptidyl-peptidase [Nonomuraea sp. MG754425]|uniref:Xaa-Pro dipeptidyl-peptidase n=1 Tax=Nonomuraea sp. MG754425 TaxID=2570319 RepID=UPI001F39D1A2|nr:Xaa-Pro dipeptidyl-peptidase [Nonomuraea sp. MG754425]MCF6471682.1 Xaa-Pro dipeptidyl-peptidase [Nonomuraea sp. MG754425]
MHPWRPLSVPLAALLVAALTGTASATPETPAAPATPAIKVEHNATQPVFSRADAILQTVFVEVDGTDSDGDGADDRVAVDILRPKETDQGLKVPVIMEASPYYAPGNDVANHPVDVDENGVPLPAMTAAAGRLEAGPFDGYYDNYFVPRGYAVALVENLGSARATGCPTSGAPNETAGPKAAIDWLNGRARGFDAAGAPVEATWSTGKVGMIGVSYNGTLPNAVAATGVPGLETIVPIAAISSWYDYYRANGGVLAPGGFQGEDLDVLAKYVLTRQNGQAACGALIDGITAAQDRVTGDYSPFWDERNYLNDVRKVKASVFLVHGLNDWNVKTKQFAQWWYALAKRHVPRKIWLHQGTHMSPFNLRTAEWLRQLHGWFDHWLHGIDSGIMREPQADVEIAPGQWGQHASWPLPGSAAVPLHLGPSSSLGLLPRPRTAAETFTDQKTRTAEQLVEAVGSDPNRLAYTTGVLPSDVRVSGTPTVSVRAAFDGGASPYLTALLVDYGSDVRPTGALVSTGQNYCYGQGVPGDTGCTVLRTLGTATTPYKIVTRGWLDVRNRHRPDRTEALRPGKDYTFTWDFQPTDYLFKKGHRLGLVIISTDHDYTLRYPAGTRITVSPGKSSVRLPVVLGRLP